MNDLSAQDAVSESSLVGQVADEFLTRLERGEDPDVEEYVHAHPEIGPLLRQVLPTLKVLRDASGGTPATAGDERSLTGSLGDYRIVREVGRGGMGIVYDAVQESLGRRVALKVLPLAAALDPRQLGRFRTEAQAAASLHHTHIVPVFGVGCERGLHFYAMQFIDGRSLAEIIQQRRQGRADMATAAGRTGSVAALATEPAGESPEYFHTVARLGIEAAEALEHAHGLGIVHRDIKPGNLLVDDRGHLWVTDFGLAQVQTDVRVTMTGDVVGTLRYMSPEQIQGRRGLVDHRSDVYSLGATLYELLTLTPAFGEADRGKLLYQIVHEEPPPPRSHNQAVPADLETIVLKAMAKEPESRYGTAQELADDLRRFLQHRPIQARRPSWWERARKWARRHRAVVWTAAVALMLLATGSVVGLTLANRRLQHEKENARAGWEKAEANFLESEESLDRACALVDRMVRDIAFDLIEHPHAEKAREKMLNEALAFLQDLLKRKGSDVRVRRRAALNHRQMGHVYALLGDLARAQQHDEEACALFEGLYRETGEAVDRCGLGTTLRGRAAMQLYHFDRPDRAAPLVAEALGHLEAAAQAQSDHLGFLYEFGCARETHGLLLRRLKRPAEALAEFEKARDLFEGLARARPGVDVYHYPVGTSSTYIAIALRDLDRPQESLEAYQKATAIWEKGRVAFPDSPRYKVGLALARFNRGHLLVGHDPRAAAAAYQSALPLREELVADFPRTVKYRVNLVDVLRNLVGLALRQGRNDEALPLLEQAVLHQGELVKASPGRADHKTLYRNLVYSRNTVLVRLGDHSAAALQAARIPPVLTGEPAAWDDAAMVLAACVPAAEKDGRLSVARRQELADDYGRQAVACLREALVRGKKDRQAPRNEIFKPLHGRADFCKLFPQEKADPPNTP